MASAAGVTGDAAAAGSRVPPLSVVMPVHNAMPYLPAAVESILAQTFTDFELFIGDDCSTDGALDCIRAFAARDPRIRYARSDVRLGPVASSNWVADEARARIVARMDADDISHPRRFELQMKVLAQHPDAAIVGTLNDLIDHDGKRLRDRDNSILLLGKLVPFAHPSIMYRNAVFQQVGRYREGTDYFEDTDLLMRILKISSILVIAETLLSVRLYGGSARLTDDQRVIARALVAASRVIAIGELPKNRREKITPGNFRALLEHTLWSGVAPSRMLPLLRRMNMSPAYESIPTVFWVGLCMASPWIARNIGRLRVSWRNWSTRNLYKAGHVYRWIPGRLAIDLGLPGESTGLQPSTAEQ